MDIDSVLRNAKDKLGELLENLQYLTATLHQRVREAAADGTVSTAAHGALTQLSEQATQLMSSAEGKLRGILASLQEAYEAQTSEESRHKVKEMIDYVRQQAETVLGDVAQTCRSSLQSLHSARTSVGAQLRIDERRRQLRDEAQKITQWSLDRVGKIQDVIKSFDDRARAMAAPHVERTNQIYGEHLQPRLQQAAEYAEGVSPDACAKVRDARTKLTDGEGALLSRAWAAVMLFLQAIAAFILAFASTITGNGVKNGAANSASHSATQPVPAARSAGAGSPRAAS